MHNKSTLHSWQNIILFLNMMNKGRDYILRVYLSLSRVCVLKQHTTIHIVSLFANNTFRKVFESVIIFKFQPNLLTLIPHRISSVNINKCKKCRLRVLQCGKIFFNTSAPKRHTNNEEQNLKYVTNSSEEFKTQEMQIQLSLWLNWITTRFIRGHSQMMSQEPIQMRSYGHTCWWIVFFLNYRYIKPFCSRLSSYLLISVLQ